MKLVGIYAICLVSTGQSYVGQSTDVRRRWTKHRYRLRRGDHQCKALQEAWDRHGEGAFDFHLLESCEPKQLTSRERFWIREVGNTFNRVAPIRAGALGYRHTPEARAKIGAAFKGREFTPEHLTRLSEYASNRPPEHRAKLAAAHKGKKLSPEERARLRGIHLGRKATPEHRAKISAALKEAYRSGRRVAWNRSDRVSPSGRGAFPQLSLFD